MFTDIETFLKYFDGLQRRTVRDIAALPPQAEDYRPAAGEGENAWAIADIVRHMAGSRLYFTRAFPDERRDFAGPARETRSQAAWLPCVEEAAREFRARLKARPRSG